MQNRALARIVAEKLQLVCAPEQIAGWLKRRSPDDENHRVSHETISRSLFIQPNDLANVLRRSVESAAESGHCLSDQVLATTA